jgi:ATP-dependent Clp protease ATP-binding subunit ClpE
MCSICKENFAVVFMTKIIDGKHIQEGLCLACARKQGVQPINQILEQSGMTEEDIESLNKQVGSMFDNIDFNDLNIEQLPNDKPSQSNPFFNFINKAFSKNEKDRIVRKSSQKSFRRIRKYKNSTKTKTQEKKSVKKKKYLDMYGSNLTEMAKENKIDKVIGRHREIDRVVQILNRRTKNNPVLIGEPGVGKTAIAEGCR